MTRFARSHRRMAALAAVLALIYGCSEESSQPGHKEGRQGSDSGMLAAPDARPGAAPAAPSPLNDTRWKLVEIQRMNDTVEKPRDPDDYIFAFRSDGTLAMKLNCNRASGPWKVTSTDKDGGGLDVGPVAMTRAKCPQPSLDTQIGRDLEYIRSFTLEEGRLHISLMADGGIYVLEPMKVKNKKAGQE